MALVLQWSYDTAEAAEEAVEEVGNGGKEPADGVTFAAAENAAEEAIEEAADVEQAALGVCGFELAQFFAAQFFDFEVFHG